MKSYIEYTDAFSQKLNLQFQGREYFSTFLGGFMTISIVILSVVLTLDLGNELFLKKKPNTSFNTIIMPSAPKIEIENNNMVFAVSILDKNFQVFDYQNYFDIQLFLYKKKLNVLNDTFSKEELINLNLTNCSNKQNLFIDSKLNKYSFNDDYKINNLKSAKCLENNYYTKSSDNKLNQLFIEGEVTTQNYSNLKFILKKCNNTKNSFCKPNNEINNILADSHFAFYFIDKSINPFSFETPFIYFLNAYFTKLDNILYKKVDFYFKNSTISTDTGIMFQEYIEETEYTFNYLNEQTFSAYSDVLFELTLNSSRNSEFFKRFYMKIQDLAAMIGGIVKICMVLGELICKFFNRHIMYIVILNKLFNFKIKSEELDIIKSNINMNDILDKQSENSVISKVIQLKERKNFNRRRSAVFLNTKAIHENIVKNQEIISEENKKNENNQKKKFKK